MQGLQGAGIGAALGAAAGGILASAGLLNLRDDRETITAILAIQAHAIVTAALASGLEDDDFLQGVRVSLIGLIYYALAIGWALGLVWIMVKMFGKGGALAFLNDLPHLLRYPFEIIVGLAATGAWALFGLIFIGPAWRDDAPEWLSGGIVVVFLGGSLSVILALFALVAGMALHSAGATLSPIDSPTTATIFGLLYGAYQGYVIGRFITS